MAHIETDTDGLHLPLSDQRWSESFYFNFHDQRLIGHVYISARPNQGTIDRLATLILDDQLTLAFARQERYHAPQILSGGDLCFECLEPFRRWRFQQAPGSTFIVAPYGQELRTALAAHHHGSFLSEGHLEPGALGSLAKGTLMPVSFDLVFETDMPPYYNDAVILAECVGHSERIEQSGRVHGHVRIGAQEVAFRGTGTRDHAWGTRDWDRSDYWHWANLQWEDSAWGPLFINCGRIVRAGQCWSSGFVYRDGQMSLIKQTLIEEVTHAPTTAQFLQGQLRLITTDDQEYGLQLEARSFYHIHIAQGEGWLNHASENFVRAILTKHPEKTGRGVLEYCRRETREENRK